MDEALDNLKLSENFQVITDKDKIKEDEIECMPALMINGRVMIEGELPEVIEVIDLIKEFK